MVAALTTLAAVSREDMAIFAGIALLIHFVITGRRAWLAALGSGSALLGIWYTTLGIHLFAPFNYYMWYRFADFGDSPGAVLGNLGYTIPTALQRVIRPQPVVAIAVLLLPFLVVGPFVGWRYAWPGFLVILSNAISADPFIPTIYYQYYIVAVVFFIWAGAHAFKRHWLAERLPRAVVATILVWLIAGPIGLLLKPPWGRSFIDVAAHADRQSMASAIERISPHASVSAGTYLLSHLAEREAAYTYPAPMICSPTILAYHEFTSYPDYVIVEPGDFSEYPLDLRSLGYAPMGAGDRVQVWQSQGDHPAPEQCPSAEDARRATFQQLKDRAG